MSFLLDSNTCIQFLNQRSETLIQHLTDTPDEEVFVCSVVKAELLYGARKSRNPERSRRAQEAFLGRYASLWRACESRIGRAEAHQHTHERGEN